MFEVNGNLCFDVICLVVCDAGDAEWGNSVDV